MRELNIKDKRNKALEEEFVREKSRADLWKKMIKIAEDQLSLDIRKKFEPMQAILIKNETK